MRWVGKYDDRPASNRFGQSGQGGPHLVNGAQAVWGNDDRGGSEGNDQIA
jgi:hypothetical protein